MDSIVFLIFRRMRAPLLTLIATYSVAILGMVLIPGADADGNPWQMDLFHAFYFVSFMSTTIGFGEIPYAFTDAQRLWATLCIYATVVVWLYSIGSLIALLQDPALRSTLAESRFRRRVRRINEPFYLVCGYGQTGSGLVRAMTDRGQRAVVIDANSDRVNLLRLESLREFVPALCADSRLPRTLLLGGLRGRHCAGVLALTSSNEVNLKIAIASKLMHAKATVVCRADSHDIEKNMASFGTDYIYDPFDIFAVYLASALHSPGLTLLQDWLGGLRGEPVREPIRPPNKGLWVLCGYGRFGKAVYQHLAGRDIEVIVIEARPERTGAPPGRWIHGRGTEAITLNQADIGRAVGLVAGTDDDTNNLSIVMTAKQLNDDLFCVVRENHLDNQELFNAVAADIIMHPSSIVANRIRVLISTPMLIEFIELARREDDSWACALLSRIIALEHERVPDVWEVRIDDDEAYALTQLPDGDAVATVGHLITDPRDRDRRLPAIALLLLREDTRSILPRDDQALHGGDRLLFCGRPAARSAMGWTLQNSHALSYVLHGSSPPRGIVWCWLMRHLGRTRDPAADSAGEPE